MKIFHSFKIFILLLFLHFTNTVNACDDSSVILVSSTNNGNGTFTYVIRMCLEFNSGLDPSLDEFRITVNGSTIAGFSPATVSHLGQIYTGTNTATALTYTCPNFPIFMNTDQCYDISITTNGIPTSFVCATNTSGAAWECLNRTIVIGGTNNTTCATTTFTDPGGAANYPNNNATATTICPSSLGGAVVVNFNTFDVRATFGTCLDQLQIYQGSSPVLSNQIGVYCTGNAPPTTITSTASDGCLTFLFNSDGSGTASGWNATVSCTCSTPTASLTVTNNTGCLSPNGSIDVTSNGGTYLWSNGSTTQDLVGVAGGSYTVTISNGTGCTISRTATVNNNQSLPTASVSGTNNSSCTTANGSIDLTAGGTGLSYAWSNGATTQDITGLIGGSYTVTVTATGNCTTTAQTTISNSLIYPIINAGNDSTLTCSVRIISLNGVISYPNNNYSIEWTTINGNILSGSSSESPAINVTGKYYLKVVDMSTTCSSIDSVIINENMIQPIANAGNDLELTCSNNSVTLNGSASSMNNVSFDWQPSSQLLGTNNLLNAQTNIAGTYTLTVTNLQNGCTDNDTVIVNEIANNINLNITNTSLTCFNSNDASVQVYIQGGVEPYRIIWNTPNADTTRIVNGLSGGNFSVTVTDNNGCINTNNIEIVTPDSIKYDILIDSISCFGKNDGRITFQNVNSPNEPVQIEIDDLFFTTYYEFASIHSGWHNFTLKDRNNCIQNTQVYMPDPDEIMINAGSDIEIDLGDSIQLNPFIVSADSFSLQWKPLYNIDCSTCQNPIVKPFVNTYYVVELIDKNGCKASDGLWVKVDTTRNVFIPNAFTPNSDGANDRITIYAKSNLVKQVVRFAIYDRWGEKVFEQKNFPTNNEYYGWDGIFKNKLMNPEVFVYEVEIEFLDNRHEIFKGDITLIR